MVFIEGEKGRGRVLYRYIGLWYTLGRLCGAPMIPAYMQIVHMMWQILLLRNYAIVQVISSWGFGGELGCSICAHCTTLS